MGLDLYVSRIDHEGPRARWSYSGFNDFRRRLASEVGISLPDMLGFGGSKAWPSAEAEPLVWLLDHSDCDGWLDYAAAEKLAPRLREIIEGWPDDFDKTEALALCDMLDDVLEYKADRVVFQ